ncbi:MAG: hypothetical protein OXH16_07690 [Gemmatimonadetes bacterium]|nr:hypothetical protein [Gemmatimonadota bacterium]
MRWLIACFLLGCGGVPVSPENELLSDFMSIANVHREPIHNATGDIVGVNIRAEVVNTGPVPIISPFIMTWKLRISDSEEIARATHRFTSFEAGQVQRISLNMSFAPRSNLSDVQNVVTFDFEERSQ